MKDAQAKKYLQFFAKLSSLFEARFLMPLWQRYPSIESDDWEAVGLFLNGYGSERQGAKPDYSHVGVDIAERLNAQGMSVVDDDSVQSVWGKCCESFNERNLNHANNPLCPCGTGYERRYKGQTRWSVTSKKSIIEFLQEVAKNRLQPNIVVFARTGLELDRVEEVHSNLQDINGIGPKIASLFLRDVAVFYCYTPSKHRYLLQPVDTWVQRVCNALMLNQNIREEKVDVGKVQKWIVQESLLDGISPERVNEGIWYFSSQVADSDYRLLKALGDVCYARHLVEEHIKAVRGELCAWDTLSWEAG